MIVENVFTDTIFPELKEYVETNSIYNPVVTKKKPQESKVFPIVPVNLLPITNKYNNLIYGEETFTFGINIEIYAIDTTINSLKVSKRTICDEVTSKVVEYFKKYHVTITTNMDAINTDSNVHRNVVTINGILDTKYGLDNLVIYPR